MIGVVSGVKDNQLKLLYYEKAEEINECKGCRP